ncbi:MAG TPA: AI-2E family transporter [Methylomirabilota bacterium]|nr:AI-2E family transporter [Methylomirabilota bacterium]
MTSSGPGGPLVLRDRAFLLLLLLVSVGFAWILWPFYGAVLWGTMLAIVFAPLNRRLTGRFRGRRTAAALVTLVLVIVIVILPLIFVGALLVDQAADVYARVKSGELNVGEHFQRVVQALPGWAARLLERFGLTELTAVQQRLSDGLMRGSQFFAAQALTVGQRTFDVVVSFFVMLYLLFFFFRDGDDLVRRIRAAVPLSGEHQRALSENFTLVIRAIVKGTVVVAIVQGALGGFMFWLLGIRGALLWGVVMAVFSLIPAIGTAIVWLPVAVYLLATGAVWSGLILLGYGVLVIGLVDNVLRPVLVGKDSRMPDYVVLVATLGGLAVFGANGIVLGPIIAALFLAAWDIVSASRPR